MLSHIVGTVLVGTTDANLEQIRGGFAWFYRDYANDVAPDNRTKYAAAEADAIAVRLGELGRVVERPVLAEEVPPQSELERETERIMDSENGGLVQGADGGWVTASDAALAESIGQAELERELGRVREELGLDRPAFPGGDVP
jgi:hypothetical protein